jgi:HK97 gp10 family phage protein
MINMKVTGLDELLVKFEHAAQKVPDNARKVMHREAAKVVKKAQLYAPVDKHNLEKAIHIEKSYGTRGRLSISIVVGGVVDGVNVDQYAALIHENYESMKPGAETIAKRDANPGVDIGRKFLERAAAESKKRLESALIKSVMSDMKELEG